MTFSESRPRPIRRLAARRLALVLATSALALAGFAAAIALGATPTVSSATNAQLGEQVLVSGQGRTLYELSPETSRHLLCKSSQCTKIWPPLTVASANAKLVAGVGVSGHLALLRRARHSFQVTLDGRPLYRYANDAAAGEANGQGIKGFGGTWHVVKLASATSPMAPSPTPAPTPSPPPTPPYGY
jgi:predicted lipoprotein with Yx(FWY)xxD motif